MNRFSIPILAILLVLMSCNSRPEGVSAADERTNHAKAVANVGCIYEDQKLCTELVQKRDIVGMFFSPVLSNNLKRGEKEHGKNVLSFRIIEAAANIRQCNRTSAQTVALVPKMDIGGEDFSFLATSPVSETSSCFLTKLEG